MDNKTSPLNREAITFFDTLLAKWLLLAELLQISEFAQLRSQARSIPEAVIKAIKPKLENILTGLSPEACGALITGEKAYSLYDRDALNEAEAAAIKLHLLTRAVNEFLEKERIKRDYQSRLEAIVKPLGVPGLVGVVMLLDLKEWGIDRIFTAQVAGPSRDLLESMFIRGLTDLSPVEAMSETQASLIRRMRRKVSPLSRHVKRYALQQRIRLWVRNVVHGESIHSIARELQNNVERPADAEPGEWVKRQIRDASKILEVKRPLGRPRKGGVLRYWKLMVK
jgi:uncharacterized membrane protein